MRPQLRPARAPRDRRSRRRPGARGAGRDRPASGPTRGRRIPPRLAGRKRGGSCRLEGPGPAPRAPRAPRRGPRGAECRQSRVGGRRVMAPERGARGPNDGLPAPRVRHGRAVLDLRRQRVAGPPQGEAGQARLRARRGRPRTTGRGREWLGLPAPWDGALFWGALGEAGSEECDLCVPAHKSHLAHKSQISHTPLAGRAARTARDRSAPAAAAQTPGCSGCARTARTCGVAGPPQNQNESESVAGFEPFAPHGRTRARGMVSRAPGRSSARAPAAPRRPRPRRPACSRRVLHKAPITPRMPAAPPRHRRRRASRRSRRGGGRFNPLFAPKGKGRGSAASLGGAGLWV